MRTQNQQKPEMSENDFHQMHNDPADEDRVTAADTVKAVFFVVLVAIIVAIATGATG